MFESDRTARFEDLQFQAMLYAAGEMSSDAAEAFESRLAMEADVQQALVQAVQLAGLLDGRCCLPSPAYREVVRDTVLKTSRSRRRRGHWFVAASACAALALSAFILASHRDSVRQARQAIPHWEVTQTDSLPPESLSEIMHLEKKELDRPSIPVPAADDSDDMNDPADLDDGLGEPESWTELASSDWIRKVLEEEQRRRLRLGLRSDDLRIGRPAALPH